MNNHYSLLKTWLIILLLLPLAAMAQKMKVESMLSTIDQTANLAENLHKDNNGDYIPHANVQFPVEALRMLVIGPKCGKNAFGMVKSLFMQKGIMQDVKVLDSTVRE